MSFAMIKVGLYESQNPANKVTASSKVSVNLHCRMKKVAGTLVFTVERNLLKLIMI